MTNQEAIETIKLAQAQIEWEYPMDYAAAFDMAISALQMQEAKHSTEGSEELKQEVKNSKESSLTQNALDTISRQAAIDAIRASTLKYTGFMEMEMYTDDDAVEAIEDLPSAQPDNRLEKIADLVEGTIDHFDRDDAMDLLYQIKEVFK